MYEAVRPATPEAEAAMWRRSADEWRKTAELLEQRAIRAERHATNLQQQVNRWLKAATAYYTAHTYFGRSDKNQGTWLRAKELYLDALDAR